jgi:DNA-binding LacI/PurR family transcriptional regulator
MVPKYIRVKRDLKQQIESGKWQPGNPFPTEVKLLEQFDVSRPTLVRSLQELAREGYLHRTRGRGTVVADFRSRQSTLIVHFFVSEELLSSFNDSRLVLSGILDGAGTVARQCDAHLVTHPLPQRPLSDEVRGEVSALRPRAAVVMEPSWLPGLCEFLQEIGCVVWSANEPIKGVDSVYIDQEQAAYLATRCLVSEGRQHIALLNGPADMYWGLAARRDGYLRALRESGMKPDPRLMLEVYRPLDSEAGRVSMRQLLDKQLPLDGAVCVTDRKAIGAMGAAQEADVRIPDDLAIVSIDDDLASQATPPLTSVHMPFKEVGALAVEQALKGLETTPKYDHRTYAVLSPALTLRNSGGAMPKGGAPLAACRPDGTMYAAS